MDTTAEEPLQHEDQGTQQISKSRIRARSRIHCATIVILVVSVVVLIVGIVLIVKSSKSPRKDQRQTCDFGKTTEGNRLKEFLTKMKDRYFQLHPHKIDDPESDMMKYKPYTPTPSVLKTITDTSRALYTELSNLNIDPNKLTSREQRALAQAKHYLKHTFGQPYGVNYYAGDWMMGPNLFCMDPICKIKDDIHDYLENFKLHDLDDFTELRENLKRQAKGIDQYIENVKDGVKVGMVRSIEECKAGVHAIRQNFPNISLFHEKGVLHSEFVRPALKHSFLSRLSKTDQNDWLKQNSLSVKQTIRRDLVDFIGKSIVRLIEFLENHTRFCVPSSVSSGLARLPLDYQYLNQQRTDKRTSKILPTGEPLNGSKSYEMIMSFFTTTSITPGEVNEIGQKQLQILYPQALKIARKLTKLTNESEVVEKFGELQRSPKYKFNEKPFPDNESDSEAQNKCSTIERAKKWCPKRWEATQKYWNEARMAMNLLLSKTVSMFYFNGLEITVPACPVEMVPVFNPSIGVESYRPSDKMCTSSANFRTPFFVENFRPSYEVWTVTAHETVPGHHTQLQGYREHFRDHCSDIASWLEEQTYYTASAEGWALYAENPLISDTDTYDTYPMQQFAMLKSQIFRALRLVIDTGLHYKGLTRNDSLSLFDKYIWDNNDMVRKEVTRYQSVFGQATAYMIGKLHIEKLRNYAGEKLGDKFNLKDFHYQILSQGTVPLEYLTSHIHKYVDCALDDAQDYCDEKNSADKSEGNDVKKHRTRSRTMKYNRRLHYF